MAISLFNQVKIMLASYIDEDQFPADVAIEMFINSTTSQNPYAIIYKMVQAADIKGSLMASQYSDDGVTFKDGTALATLVSKLPMLEKTAKVWDAEHGASGLTLDFQTGDIFSRNCIDFTGEVFDACRDHWSGYSS